MSCLILALALSGCASAGPPRESGDSWVLAWEDDFNGTALNPERWRVTIQGWNWNEELQAFTRENVAVRDGCLELSAKRESWRGPSGRPDKPGVTVLRQYTSGEASTRDSWTYGKFEARVKAAGTRGVVSAFWMVPLDGDWPPEIDIAEILGRFPFSVYFTNHYNHPWNHRKNSFKYHGTEDYSDGFHVFAAEWEPGAIRWYVDGVMRARCAGGVPDERFVMKFTLAVGSEWTGPPDGSSVFPQRMLIDWVRVYRRGAGD
jgi:beta-glucanase (GH16 family)